MHLHQSHNLFCILMAKCLKFGIFVIKTNLTLFQDASSHHLNASKCLIFEHCPSPIYPLLRAFILSDFIFERILTHFMSLFCFAFRSPSVSFQFVFWQTIEFFVHFVDCFVKKKKLFCIFLCY